MASQRQLEANRANARRSTGPKSERGKARSRMNALTHGLTAKKIIVAGEKPEDFDAFRDALFADLNPGSALERELVDRLTGLLWRLRRLPEVEAELLSKLMGRSSPFDPSRLTDEELDQISALYEKMRVTPAEHARSDLIGEQGEDADRDEGLPRSAEMLNILARYESSLMNGVTRTINLIYILQAQRIAAKESARTLHATPCKGRLSALKTCSPSSQSPRG